MPAWSLLLSTPVHPGDALAPRQRLAYILVLGALVGLGPFTIDLYLPALPLLASDFRVSDAAIQLTLTGTTIGFALGQLLVGPWSDRVGRRVPLLLATLLHISASLGAALSADVSWLLVFRVLQGMGAAGGAVVALATVRDLFGGRSLVVMLSRLALVTTLAPIIAPLLGSQLLLITNWRGLFTALAGYGVLVGALAAFFLVETIRRGGGDDGGAGREKVSIRRRYGRLFSDRVFVGVAIVGAMQFTGLFSYISSSPFLFQEVFGLSAQQFGLLFGVNSVGIFFGSQLSSRLTRVVGPQWILAGTTAVQFLAATAIVLFSAWGFGLWGVLVPLFFFITACGFGFPMVQVLALINHGR